MKLNKEKITKTCKILFALFIFFIVIKESIGVIASFDLNTFKTYADKLTIMNIGIIIALGIISYLPLSLYDFVLKKRAGIDLDNKKLYKYSWIASSIASVAGFGGSTAIGLKNNFYKDHVKDNKLLIKEISKIVALNFTGFSIVCFGYVLTNLSDLKFNSLINVVTILISLYIPILTVYLIYKYIKGVEVEKIAVKDAVKIILISTAEWISTLVLVYGILIILDVKIEVFQFIPIFIIAILVAIVSMSPGGIGSFDLSLIIGLRAFDVPSEKVLLAIFLYRASYYLIPLIIGLLLYAHEMWLKIDEDIADIITTALSKVAHIGIIILVFLSGVILLINEAIPDVVDKIAIVRKAYYLSIMHPVDKLGIIVGFLLIAISRLLIYKSKKIYKLTLGLVALAILVTFVGDVDYNRTIYLIGVAILLWISKKQYYRESFVMRWGIFLQDILILLSFQILYLYTVYVNLHGIIGKIPLTNYKIQHIKNYGNGMLIISVVGFIISLLFLGILYYKNRKNDFPRIKLSDCEEDVNLVLDKFEGNSVIHFVYLDDKFVYFNKDKDVFMQYQIYANKIVILGNPVGNKEKIFESIQELYDLGDRYGYTPVFCSIDKTLIPYLHETGYEFMKLGEEAAVNLNDFTLQGRKMKSVRNALSRVEKEEYTFEIVKPPFNDQFIIDIKDISDEWLGGRKEKGFSIGFFDIDYLSREPIAVVKNSSGEIKGFTNIMPMYDNNQTLSIDLMRFSHSACNGIMDFMFVNLFEWGRANGYSRFNMGLAPLSNVGISKYSFLREKIAFQVYLHGQNFYSFKGLKKFKEKYCESWDGRYMAYRKRTSLVITMTQLILLISKENM